MGQKVLLVESGNTYAGGIQNVTLYTDSQNKDGLTNADLDKAIDHTKIAGGSIIYTEKLEIGVFNNSQEGVDSINWQEEE